MAVVVTDEEIDVAVAINVSPRGGQAVVQRFAFKPRHADAMLIIRNAGCRVC